MEHELGFMIRKARYKKNWSVDEFIEALNIDFSPTYITRIEMKAEVPNENKLIKIAHILDLDPVVVLDLAKKIKIKRFKKFFPDEILVVVDKKWFVENSTKVMLLSRARQ